MAITSGRVRLPQLDGRARDRPRVFVEEASRDDNPLSLRFSVVLPRKIAIRFADRPPAVDGRLEIREPLRNPDHRPGRGAIA